MHAALVGMSLTYTLPPLVVPRVSFNLLVNSIMPGIIVTIAIRKLQLAYIYLANPVAICMQYNICIWLFAIIWPCGLYANCL